MKRLNLSLLFLIVFIGAFLRFYDITRVPPGLYMDEASIGYNAYTILSKGTDEYGVRYPLWFKAFGEYKKPVYIYSVSLSMAAFGKSEFAVRFPSALAGTLTILVFYLLMRNLVLLDKKLSKYRESLPLLSSLLLAVFPWHVHFSRAGFEAVEALFLFTLGLYLLTLFWHTKKLLFFALGFISLILTMYTYDAYRVISPILLSVTSLYFLLKFPVLRSKILLILVLVALTLIPLIQFSLEGTGNIRFLQSSAFAEQKVSGILNKLIAYPMIFIRNYVTFFSPEYLFVSGDTIGRHQMPYFGLAWKWQLPFLITGLVFLLRFPMARIFVILLLLIAPVGGALTVPSPHSLRSLLMVIPLCVLIALGILYYAENLKRYFKGMAILIVLIAFFEFSSYAHSYTSHYPKVNLYDWGASYKEMVEKATSYEKEFDYIIVEDNFGFAPIYFKFYNDALPFRMVSSNWEKPTIWEDKRVLYIRAFYGKEMSDKAVHTIYLENNTRDVFAEFWEV